MGSIQNGKVKKISIISLHLGYGGIERAVCSLANLFADQPDKHSVKIYSVYRVLDKPAFYLDPRVKVEYLFNELPNRESFLAAVKSLNILKILREGIKSARVLIGKKRSVIRAIKSISSGIIITTRTEHNKLLSKYGKKELVKIAQLHHDHRFSAVDLKPFRYNYKNLDIVTVLTPGLQREFSEYKKGYNDHTRIVCMPNFIEQIPEIDYSKKEKIIISANRLVPVKRVDELLFIFSAVHKHAPDWRLLIAGDGCEYERLSRLSEELGISDYVDMPGKLSSEELERAMLSSSIFAMTSDNEGFGFVIVEAQSCMLPPVVFDVRVGPETIIKDGVNGFLVRDNDRTQFAEKLLLLINDGQLREQMSKKALENAKRFSKTEFCRFWNELVESAGDMK